MVALIRRRAQRSRWGRSTLPLLGALLAGSLATTAPLPAHGDSERDAALYVVTFDGPGTAGGPGEPDPDADRELMDRQESALSAVAAPEPVYRWTTALNGVAVELTERQATALRAEPRVATVEENEVRPLTASSSAGAAAAAARPPRGRGGANVVVGVVDTGIWPESPLFADSPALGSRPRRFAMSCRAAEDWDRGTCNAKLVAADWFVAGFGEDRVAADEPLSARDVRGHGTQVASIVAGNAGVSLSAPGLRGSFRGAAPRARLAAYKACWSAPDPADDGCATADLVAAIDQATRDDVDVLNLSVAGAADVDSVERALLGAAEGGTVVVVAAGNGGPDDYAGHPSPWVTTVGALTSTSHTGTVRLAGGPSLPGVMTAERRLRARAVAARDIPAPGSSVTEAARCVPGALDAARAEGRIVVCERGSIPRVAKSVAVERAGGRGMVLVNVTRRSLGHDLHAVPTVHLARRTGQQLVSWVRRHPQREVTLAQAGDRTAPSRVARWSPSGDPTGAVLKPDLVAAGTGVLAAVPPTTYASRWGFLSGTSAASARVSGAAATLLSRRDWSPSAVRSALTGTAGRLRGSVLRTGAGEVRAAAAARSRLVHEVAAGDYRAWLDGRRAGLNTASLLVRGAGSTTRRVTNVGDRADTWRVEVRGFSRHRVFVAPATMTLRPGASATYRVTVTQGGVGGLDAGTVTWVASDGARTRVPVAIGR